MKTTMVQLKKSTVMKLKDLKRFERETYDDVINGLIPEIDDEPLTKEEIKDIEEGIKDIKAGRLIPLEDVAKKYGISLKDV